MDGASDEGPSHQEVQFWWTARHLTKPTLITLVTTRSSGSSFLNRVELQNGCQSLAHANLFIPSNLNGSCFDPDSGVIDAKKLKENMLTATKIYIDRVNNAPCGSTVIKLFTGSDSSTKQELRSKVLAFVKGNKKNRLELLNQDAHTFGFIKSVWDLRTKHQVTDLPTQYIFFLKCCHERGCIHPLCQKQIPEAMSCWYSGGPLLSYIPKPIPDPSQPWGNPNCKKCHGVCHGHFLAPEDAFSSSLSPMSMSPSDIIKNAFDELGGKTPSDDDITKIAKKTLLPTDEVIIWLDHLRQVQKNRKRGADKAAETRRRKKCKSSKVKGKRQ